MRVLMIDHTCVQPSYQKKCIEIDGCKDIELKVLVPHKWKENFNEIEFSLADGIADSLIDTGKVLFPGYGHRSFYYSTLFKLLKSYKPDIIHIQQEPHSIFAFQTVLFAKLLSLNSKIIVRTSISQYKDDYRKFFPLRFSYLYYRIDNYVLKNSDCIQVVNEKAKEVLRKRGYNKKITVIPHGIDKNLFYPKTMVRLKKKLNIPEDKMVIGYLGKLIEEKGVQHLLEALSILNKNNYLLIILGDGPYRTELEGIIKNNDLEDQVFLTGLIEHDQVPLYLNLMDILVLPSFTMENWEEYFGRVLIEAMACKTAVLGSTCGEIPNVVADAGLIFKEKDVKDLSENLKMYLSNSALVKELKEKGYKRVMRNYTMEAVAEKTVKMYRELEE